MGVDFVKLSKTISHALRHEPWKYGLELDDEGWVAISELLDSLRHLDPEWHDLSHADIEQMIDNSQKQRHEIENDAIRFPRLRVRGHEFLQIGQEVLVAFEHGNRVIVNTQGIDNSLDRPSSIGFGTGSTEAVDDTFALVISHHRDSHRTAP